MATLPPHTHTESSLYEAETNIPVEDATQWLYFCISQAKNLLAIQSHVFLLPR